jgi:hypothetical protein
MVLAEVTPNWERALARAEARNITARLSQDVVNDTTSTTYFRVGSWSRTGLEHGVKVTVDARVD